jgi:hypothetical protein
MYNKEDPDRPLIIPDPTARPEDFSWNWYGKSGYVTVSLTVERGVLAGRIWLRDRRFALRPSAAGLLLAETNSAYWRTHPEVGRTDALASLSLAMHGRLDQPGDARAIQGPGWNFLCPGSPPAGQHVIDVLVLYTSGLLADLGSHANVAAYVEDAKTDANHALRNSGVHSFSYSLRGVELLPNSAAYDTSDIEDALIDLSGWESLPSAPYCSFSANNYVRTRRNAMWADIVALARHDLSGQGSCGLSFIQRGTSQGCIYEPGSGFNDYAYMIFDPDCGADRLNFAHELGHQLGVEHDPRNSPSLISSGTSSCPWSFAHRFVDPIKGFRTVMSTDEAGSTSIPGPDCTIDPDCPIIDAFSNPALEWTGVGGVQPVGSVPYSPRIGVEASHPMGWQPANAVDTLRRLAPVTAAFRPRPDAIFNHGFQP